PMVRLEQVSVRKRGKTLLQPTSVDLPNQGVTAIVGPNGAGKSTLLRLLHGLERAKGGRVVFDPAIPPSAQSFVFQTPIVLRRSVYDNLIFPLQIRGWSKGDMATAAQNMAARFDLDEVISSDASALSGGEKQKLAMARALITGPKILFLDEPSANLDRSSTQTIESAVKKVSDAGTKVFMASHSLAQVKRLADDVVFVQDGRVAAPEPVTVFFDHSSDPDARDWLQEV
ncbi:MAG: ATP-binding cassette domain-containing protein, partial [Planktomarina sp.]